MSRAACEISKVEADKQHFNDLDSMAQDSAHESVEVEAPQQPVASSSTPLATSSTAKAPVKNLILDAGPLLSLLPLRGTAQKF